MRRCTLLSLLFALLLSLSACAGRSSGPLPVSEYRVSGGQLLLVLADDFDSRVGELRAYERGSKGWELVRGPLFVNLGRNGLAWGAGLHGENPAGAQAKREGDGRAPVGAFALGEGFASDPAEVGETKIPVLRADEDLVCVDDLLSPHYNAIVRKADVKPDWNSVEDMLRKDGQYRLGAFVRHNADPVRPGGGSCIFIHIWLKRDFGSSGCTNMAPDDMLALLRWLDPSRQPVLVQLPKAEYGQLRTAWNLPDIGR